MEMNLLPPYCPHLAPVEMVFAIVKKEISLRYSGIRRNFSFSDGKNAIVEAMIKIDLEVGLKLWKRFIKEAKSWIWEANIERTLNLQNFKEEAEDQGNNWFTIEEDEK